MVKYELFLLICLRCMSLQELFVPINTKGELYEVCPEELSPAEWEPAGEGRGPTPPPPEVAARAHRLPHLLSIWRLPTRVRLLAGTVPIEMAHDVGGQLKFIYFTHSHIWCIGGLKAYYILYHSTIFTTSTKLTADYVKPI